jgi:hypothetical protein
MNFIFTSSTSMKLLLVHSTMVLMPCAIFLVLLNRTNLFCHMFYPGVQQGDRVNDIGLVSLLVLSATQGANLVLQDAAVISN